MKKQVSRVLALLLAASLALSGCGGSGTQNGTVGDSTTSGTNTNTESSGEEIKDLVYPRLQTRELETFNVLYSQRAEDGEALANLVDGLLEADPAGQVQPAIATEWGSEDGGVTWTFKLRDGVKWVDMNGQEMADCNAWDFATGLEWVLNFHKNDSANTTMPIEMIKGASEYYEYTKTLSADEAKALKADEGSKFLEMVGIQIPDDLTVVYTCLAPKPYFDTLGTYVCLFPAPQALIDQLGVDGYKAMDNTTMWYNGPYTMTSYIQNNEKIFTKNPLYWDTEAKLFDTITYKMVESADVAFQLYQAGELDYVQLSESAVKTISSDPNNEYHDYLVPDVPSKYSYQIQLNYQKNKEDGTPDDNWNIAVANEAFRLSWMHGVDLKEYYKRTNALDPMACENNYFTMKGLVYTSDGTDYVDLVGERLGLPEPNGETMVRVDADKAAQYKQQAIEELTAAGVTFPVEADYYISAASQTALDSANVLKQCFSDSLGDDYVKINIKTYVSSLNTEVRDPQLQAFTINGWGADYGDPQNYLVQEAYGNPNAYYSEHYNNINHVEENEYNKAVLDAYKEYTALVEKANAINDDLDARYNAFADAEAYLLQHALVIPCNYGVTWCLSHIDNTSRINAMFGSVNEKFKNYRTSVDAYTTEQMNAISGGGASSSAE